MDDFHERWFREIATLSKNIFLLFFIAAIGGLLAELLQIGFLRVIFVILFLLSALVSWITPGVFIVLGRPRFAHAWLFGINPIMISSKLWNELSSSNKLGIITQSIIMTLFATTGLIMVVVNSLEK